MNIVNIKDRRYGNAEVIEGSTVYVGRPSKWGNPYVIGRDGDRDEVIDKFRVWAWSLNNSEWRASVRRELKGKTLECYCHPLPCHAQVLIEIAEEDYEYSYSEECM
jgi:hypothetical protein